MRHMADDKVDGLGKDREPYPLSRSRRVEHAKRSSGGPAASGAEARSCARNNGPLDGSKRPMSFP